MRKPRLRLGADDVLTADAQDVAIDAESAVGDQEGDCLGDIARLALGLAFCARSHVSIHWSLACSAAAVAAESAPFWVLERTSTASAKTVNANAAPMTASDVRTTAIDTWPDSPSARRMRARLR